MASMKQIKKRKKSVEATGKITKAMKLVASVKLQKTKQIATDATPYFDATYETVCSILKHAAGVNHKYSSGNPNGKKAIIVISSNKGLAGGYNSSIIKKILDEDEQYRFTKDDTLVYALGTKVRDELARRGFEIKRDYPEAVDDVNISNCREISSAVVNDFEKGEINEVYLVYTFFKNTMVHIPRVLKLFPIALDVPEMNEETELIGKRTFVPRISQFENDGKMPMNFETEEDEVVNKMIPHQITALIFGALTASVASENGARMTAMDSATKNAKELAEKLGKMYNSARQGAITQEITEIVAGANAI